MNAITYRSMEAIEELVEVEDLQCVVWGMSKSEALSATTMRWMIHIGGLLIGAWDGDRLIGFSVGSPGKREGKWVFWSDMAGIHPDYQSRGIGYELKLFQKTWAREQGFEEIRWTFDPMRRGNAYFNFCKLGVISSLYHHSFYGVMKDSLNTGLYTDRLEAVWSTSDEKKSYPALLTTAPFVVEFDGQDILTRSTEAQTVCIQIPFDLNILKNDNLSLAINWQKAIRETFVKYFRFGYQTVGFVKKESICWYILHKI